MPSWGVQNEITLGEVRADPRPVVARLVELVRAEDPTRPTAQANLGQVPDDDPIIGLVDLNAMNVYCGWYYGAAGDIGEVMDGHHEANPGIPLGLSEYGADAYEGYHAAEPVPGDYTEEYQAVLHEQYGAAIAERPWLWSTFVWNMFDFASDLRAEGGRRGRNMKGLVTYDRTIRKDAFYWYKANWSVEPFVHLCSKRFTNRHTATVGLKVYSNCDEVRLELNGHDQGPGVGAQHIFAWDVRLEGGVNTVRVTGDGPDGPVHDEAEFRLVDSPDESYVCPEPARFGARDGATGAVASWYEQDGIEADHSLYSTWTPIGDLLDNPDCRAVLVDVLGEEMLDDPRLAMAGAFTVDFLAGFVPDTLSEEVLRELHGRLSAIPKP
jgi:beta-galactosidase